MTDKITFSQENSSAYFMCCNELLLDRYRFCPYCGKVLNEDDSSVCYVLDMDTCDVVSIKED